MDVVVLKGLVGAEEAVVFGGLVKGKPPRGTAGAAIVVEPARRVALHHHAALLSEDRLHLLREEEERRVQRAGLGRAVGRRPSEDRDVAGVVDGRENRAALVVAAALRRRERAAQQLGRLTGL